MYEEYMQNFFNYPMGGYRNTYESNMCENCGMNYGTGYEMVENYPYSYNSRNMQNFQPRNTRQELEECYPEIYRIVYPMVKKVCATSNRSYGKEDIDRMVEEVYQNVEANDAVELNITLNNDVRGVSDGESSSEFDVSRDENREEKRQIRRNNGLNDLIRILVLRELLGRPGCFGPNCRPGMGPRPPMPPRPPFPRYEVNGL